MQTFGLPISIESLLEGQSVEWERLEFKKGWNPEAFLHTMCAFANDFHNLGGGYILIGVEERNGRPVLPPEGVDPDKIDSIQKEILNLGYSAIQPAYHPLTLPTKIQDKHILAIWVPGGETRPYKAKTSLSEKSLGWSWYIRKQSSTVIAKNADEQELISLAAKVPFDDRFNQSASLTDLSLRLIEDFLKEIGSDLAEQAPQLPMESLGRMMNIVGGPAEAAFPKNVGLMFFNLHPENFFPATQIDVVWFPDGPGGDIFEEKSFKGPLDHITRDALNHIARSYLKETVIKHPDRAEAERFWNYPYAAIEEAVVNAVYHRSYEVREPIEIRIQPDELTILSFPGPDRSIQLNDLVAGKAVSRRYRNRRIGEFFKELDLTEGRSTGIPKILRALEQNGSPSPAFETDEDRNFFLVRFPVHPKALTGAEADPSGKFTAVTQTQDEAHDEVHDEVQDEVHDEVHDVSETEWQILNACAPHPQSTQEILKVLGYESRTGNFRVALARLLNERNALERTIPEAPRSKKQQYRLTEKGRKLLENQP
ncbi:MAG: putative DNA binding domain-containing protein [Phycisphaeraceae bacterium]|nr:putative DNA binding domain-containing protein [Phycisphaeraceae bacterium]